LTLWIEIPYGQHTNGETPHYFHSASEISSNQKRQKKTGPRPLLNILRCPTAVKKKITVHLSDDWMYITGNWISTPQNASMTMEKQPFEDVSPNKKMLLFYCHVIFRGCTYMKYSGGNVHKI